MKETTPSATAELVCSWRALEATLPAGQRILNDPLPSGFAKGGVNELDKLLPEYYSLRGWDAEGVPGSQKLSELGLG